MPSWLLLQACRVVRATSRSLSRLLRSPGKSEPGHHGYKLVRSTGLDPGVVKLAVTCVYGAAVEQSRSGKRGMTMLCHRSGRWQLAPLQHQPLSVSTPKMSNGNHLGVCALIRDAGRLCILHKAAACAGHEWLRPSSSGWAASAHAAGAGQVRGGRDGGAATTTSCLSVCWNKTKSRTNLDLINISVYRPTAEIIQKRLQDRDPAHVGPPALARAQAAAAAGEEADEKGGGQELQERRRLPPEAARQQAHPRHLRRRPLRRLGPAHLPRPRRPMAQPQGHRAGYPRRLCTRPGARLAVLRLCTSPYGVPTPAIIQVKTRTDRPTDHRLTLSNGRDGTWHSLQNPTPATTPSPPWPRNTQTFSASHRM